MVSDINTEKSRIATVGAQPLPKGTTSKSGSGIDFAEIIRNNGAHLESGLNALSDRAGITGVTERSDNAPAASDHSGDRASYNNDNGGSRADTDEHSEPASDHDVSSQPERSNDYSNDRSQDSRMETAETAPDPQESTQHTENHGENAARDDRPEDTSNNDAASTQETDTAETVNAADGDDGEQAAVKGEGENNAGEANKGETATDGTTASNAKQMLNTLLANAQGAALPGQASGQAQENNTDGLGKINAAQGLNAAIANVGKQTEGNATNTGQSTANSNNAQAQAQTHNLANSQGAAQAQTSANAGTQAAGEAQAKDITKAAEQAAQISKMVGNGNKVEVSVTVTDEKSTMISKPSASLTSNAALATDTNAPTLRKQESQGANNAGGQAQTQQVAGQATSGAGPAQQTAQQTAGGQAQSANGAATDAKGTILGTQHTSGAQATSSGNGETPVVAAPNSATAAQQAQQNTSTQAANSSRFTTANPALTDQVSVQISKAINAGNDKISIQLKPAEMGRIDVQMEVGHDGRVTAVVTADNKGTLDLLQKDAKELQQALQQAGLQVDNDGLSFNLREQGDGNEMAGNTQGGGDQGIDDGPESDLSLEEELAGLDRDVITDSRIDVRA